MEAKIPRIALLLAIIPCFGASYRTQNFLVTASTPEFARQVGDAAETFRRELSLEWLGHDLPAWQDPCPITVTDGPHLGAGGMTSFVFDRRRPTQWTMNIQGSRERILDSVLPHEITHTIFATHFGRPLPRWADEGACTTVEDVSERSKQERFLIEFLTTGRGIAFNRMFAMKEYPQDILPLYSQGYSLAQFLIAQGGKQKFAQYIGLGMETADWTRATEQHYGYANLSELQVKWLEWVRIGRPLDLAQTPTLLAASRKSSAGPGASSRPFTLASAQSTETPVRLASNSSAANSGSWYARQRVQAAVNREVNSDPLPSSRFSTSRPQPVGRPQQIILEPGKAMGPVKRVELAPVEGVSQPRGNSAYLPGSTGRRF